MFLIFVKNQKSHNHFWKKSGCVRGGKGLTTYFSSFNECCVFFYCLVMFTFLIFFFHSQIPSTPTPANNQIINFLFLNLNFVVTFFFFFYVILILNLLEVQSSTQAVLLEKL